MDEDELKKKEDELSGEILLPEPDDDGIIEGEEDDLLAHPLVKKDEDEDESLDDLAEEEDSEDEPYDDVDLM